MHLHKPSLVLVPDTFLSASDTAMAAIGSSGKRATSTSLLVEFIREEFPDTQLEPISRKYWNETSGTSYGLIQLVLSFLLVQALNSSNSSVLKMKREQGQSSQFQASGFLL